MKNKQYKKIPGKLFNRLLWLDMSNEEVLEEMERRHMDYVKNNVAPPPIFIKENR